MQPICLSIAGFDGSGGAGIQADLKTFSALGCYGLSVLTALPIQNTCGVKSCYGFPAQYVQEQLQCLFEDFTPLCIKIGMLYSEEIIHVVADFLSTQATSIPVVLDPVILSKNNHALLRSSAIETLKRRLFPLATLLTPNLPEANWLTGENADTETLTKKLLAFGSQAVLLKGGHAQGAAAKDFYVDQRGQQHCFIAPWVASRNTHGTGCTLSSAITAALANGADNVRACLLAKRYVWEAIQAAQHQSLGKGCGPLAHAFMSTTDLSDLGVDLDLDSDIISL